MHILQKVGVVPNELGILGEALQGAAKRSGDYVHRLDLEWCVHVFGCGCVYACVLCVVVRVCECVWGEEQGNGWGMP